MALLTINGVPQKTPSKFEVNIEDIDGESARNAKGELTRDRITTKRKLNLEFPPLTQNEASTLLTAVKPVNFSVTYPDPEMGMVTKTFYVGSRRVPMLKNDSTVSKIMWENIGFNLIEL